MIAGFGKGNDDFAELVGCLREPVDEQDGALRLTRCRQTLGVVDADFRIGLLYPELEVARLGGTLRGHSCVS